MNPLPNPACLKKLIMTAAVACAFAATPSAVDTAFAQTGTLQDNAGQLRALENRIQRQQYQQQQQQYRAQERSVVPLNRQTPQVPVMKPNCQIRIYGNATIRDCR